MNFDVSSKLGNTPAPITNGQFSNPSHMTWSEPPNGGGAVSSGTFQGTFDSPNAAHGTAQMTAHGSQTSPVTERISP
ncbi:MAG TPA: hypothetical protein VKR21_18710 [Solirubrobacteraceae bacterium]|nr:hypothetical protein [Solirubrobacteraceae bacterium]